MLKHARELGPTQQRLQYIVIAERAHVPLADPTGMALSTLDYEEVPHCIFRG